MIEKGFKHSAETKAKISAANRGSKSPKRETVEPKFRRKPLTDEHKAKLRAAKTGKKIGKPKAHCRNGHEFTADNTLRRYGAPGRRCKKCKEISAKDHGGNRRVGIRRHGITPNKYQEVFDFQCGLCAICKLPPRNGSVLTIDHDHSCCPSVYGCGNCFRGLLCDSCNRGIGLLREAPTILQSAIEYLQNNYCLTSPVGLPA